VSRAGHAGNHRPEDFSDRPRWRREAYRIIFEHDTPAGLAFDILLIVAIITSVVVVMLESVAEVQARHGALLRTLEWVFTILFTGEYALRIASARSATRYARSFYGVIDFLAILPTYLSIILPGGQAFAVIRILRVLRVFRVLKLAQYVGSERVLLSALRASAHKITVFLIAVLTLVMVVGATMYFIEGPERGFTSIPMAVYWAIVTVTTVGYGDIAPQTAFGQILAAALMIMGYGIIAVPTGIVTVQLASQTGVEFGKAPTGKTLRAAGSSRQPPPRACTQCAAVLHDSDAIHCKYCGAELPELEER
jgi:voltage-gated potassium channel